VEARGVEPAVLIMSTTESIASKGVADRARTNQVPGQFLVTGFLFILLSFAFGGSFTQDPPFDPDDAPDGYDWSYEY
jgi:hypothetical protein